MKNINFRDTKVEKRKKNIKKEKRDWLKSTRRKPFTRKKKFIITCMIFIFFVILALIFLGMNRTNIMLLRETLAKKDANIYIDVTNNNRLKLWNMLINNLKKNNNTLVLNKGNLSMSLDTNKLQKNINLNMDISYQKASYDFIKNVEILCIDLKNSNFISIFKSMEVTLNQDFIKNQNIDIYFVDENEQLVPYTKIKLTDGKVILEESEEYEKLKVKKIIMCYIPISNINVINDDITLNKNASLNLETQIFPVNATNRNIKYSVEDENIAVVSEDGVITSKAKGNTKITITVEDEKISKEILLKVNEIASGIKLSKNSVSLYEGGTTTIKATVEPEDAFNKELLWTSSDEKIAKVDNQRKITAILEGSCKIKVSTKEEPIVSVELTVKVTKKATNYYSMYGEDKDVSEPTYIKGILIVNKKYRLPSTYNPGTNQVALNAFNSMKADALKSGINLFILSGFRSYQSQVYLYDSYVRRYGASVADTFSARPGYSEHQTGLTFDVNSVEDSFAYTPAGKYLASNCHKFGFIIRYPKGKESITGYQYEPWHIRYVGVDVATSIYNSGLCLEEYLGI